MTELHPTLRAVARRIRQVQNRLPRPGRGPATRGGATPRKVTAQLAQLTAAKDHQAALELAERHLADFSGDTLFLRQARSSAGRAGAMALQRRVAALQRERAPERQEESWWDSQLEGRWRETSPDWSPRVAPTVAETLRPVTDPVAGRVLHVLKASMPYRQSGYSMRTMYTLTGQVRAGLDPVAVTALDFPATLGLTDASGADVVSGVPHLRLLRGAVPDRQPYDAYLDDWATALAPALAQQRPEVVHVHSGSRGYESALVALAVGELLRVPVVYEVRGFFESLWTSEVAWSERSETFRRRRDTETRCMQRADAVVTLSASMRQDILERGVDADTVHVVPNGVDPEVFAPRGRSTELTDHLGLRGRFVFGYVSNLDHYREGQELLIDAAVELRRRGVPASALIVGDGGRRAELERRAADLDAGDAVVFTGKVPHDEVLDYYAQLDVFVVPRVDERAARLVTPLKPFEAMAAQIPLLVSDLPALTEIIGEGSRGASFRRGDAGSLVAALLELRADPMRRARMAAAGREWVVAERAWSANGARYAAIYERVLAGRV